LFHNKPNYIIVIIIILLVIFIITMKAIDNDIFYQSCIIRANYHRNKLYFIVQNFSNIYHFIHFSIIININLCIVYHMSNMKVTVAKSISLSLFIVWHVVSMVHITNNYFDWSPKCMISDWTKLMIIIFIKSWTTKR
jgi:hypothetical protein